MPVYLNDDEKEDAKKEEVFLPYWLDVEKQKKVKLYTETDRMRGSDFLKRLVWFCCCLAGAVAVGGRSCGL